MPNILKSIPETLELPGQWEELIDLIDRHTQLQAWRKMAGKPSAILEQARDWFETIKKFREVEAQRLVDQEPSVSDRFLHRVALSRLIAAGEDLLVAVLLKGVPLAAAFKSEDIVATVQELYDTQTMWLGDLSQFRKDQILKTVFHVTPSCV